MNETKQCPYCGEEILAVAKKCRYCGEWLEPVRQNGASDEPAKIVCPVCGEEIDADVTVCPFCHEPVATSETMGNPTVSNSTQHVGEVKENLPTAAVNGNKDGVIKTYFLNVVVSHYDDFKGTMGRKEYWMFYLIYVVTLSFLCLVPICFGSMGFMIVYSVLGLAMFLPSLSAVIRRLRDAGENWPFIFFGLVPVVGQLILLVSLCSKGQKVAPTAKWTMFDTLFVVALVIICVVELLVCDLVIYNYSYYY